MEKSEITLAIRRCVIEPRDKFNHGVHARFLDLENGWGTKYFLYEKQRDENYDLQKALAEHDLAPMVGIKFKFKRSGIQMFGFFTETVVPFEQYHYDIAYSEEGEELAWGIGEELKYEALDVGFNVYDLHEANIGWCPRLDRWVIIDVSISTCDFEEHWDKHYWVGID